MKRILVIILINIFIFQIYSEKWVGRATVSKKMNGTKTQSGTAYKSDSLTIACNGFKLGAEVYIISVKTKKKIKVVVNDRIKSDLDFFLLLTPKVAKEIGLSSESEIVIVEAKFSDINSTERTNVNGLINEEEYDEEMLKKFPEIKWPDKEEKEKEIEKSENEIKTYPEEDKANKIPTKKDDWAILDSDERNLISETIINKKEEKEEIKKETIKRPEEEKKIEPLFLKKEEKLDTDDSFVKVIKKEKEVKKEDVLQSPLEENEVLPNKKEKYSYLDTYDNGKKEGKSIKKKENNEAEMEIKKEAQVRKEEAKNEIIKKEEEKKEEPILWLKDLEYNKFYVRFSTSLNKKEGDRRYTLFRKVFNGKVVGLEKGGKYILFIGPIEIEDVDKILNDIRKYGYKDAYIVKWK